MHTALVFEIPAIPYIDAGTFSDSLASFLALKITPRRHLCCSLEALETTLCLISPRSLGGEARWFAIEPTCRFLNKLSCKLKALIIFSPLSNNTKGRKFMWCSLDRSATTGKTGAPIVGEVSSGWISVTFISWLNYLNWFVGVHSSYE